MEQALNLAARLLLSQIFIISGMGKVVAYAATRTYMQSMGLPGAVLPLVILLELGGGLALLFGFRARWVAAALALFCIATALVAHRNFADQMQMINFMKNLAMAGGLLLFVRHGAGRPCIDR